jgi:hypothetical protein
MATNVTNCFSLYKVIDGHVTPKWVKKSEVYN